MKIINNGISIRLNNLLLLMVNYKHGVLSLQFVCDKKY